MTLWLLLVFGLVALTSGGTTNQRPSIYADQIQGNYIVVLDRNVVNTQEYLQTFADWLPLSFDVTVRRTYPSFKMLLVHSQRDLSSALENLPEVDYVEPDGIAYGAQICSSRLNPRTWGLDRIDQRESLSYTEVDPVDSQYIYDPDYGAGLGVDVYVVDTGIEINDPEFGGRAVWGYTSPDLREEDQDLNGHGTHCAGTVGSNSYGVAKAVSLTAVKVLGADNTGPWSSIIDGLQWTLQEHENRQNDGSNILGSVISMSVGGNAYQPVDTALQDCIDGGIPSVIAAMNNNNDACTESPARLPDAITVGAVNIRDTSASFTNWGPCVDIFAPGVDVVSTHLNGGTASYSGTSMSTPHVAGYIARFLSTLTSPPTPAEVWGYIESLGTPGAITFLPGHVTSPNLMLYAEC